LFSRSKCGQPGETTVWERNYIGGTKDEIASSIFSFYKCDSCLEEEWVGKQLEYRGEEKKNTQNPIKRGNFQC